MELMRDPTAVYSGVPHPSESQDSNLVTAENLEPRIVPRAEHRVSRKNIDEEALKVLYRLKSQGFVGYLVGGSVRDLLLERRPKDFDIATSAHTQQVRRMFKNAFTVGRRFRLVHVKFGKKVVEVATFRRQTEVEEGAETLIRSDNTFGTPAEDAFRRDFTVNALFYDIANFSVIDYVGGLQDLENKLIRAIGDPSVRFREDPVRMLRAVALAARLDFTIDRDSVEAIRTLRGEIAKSSPARLLEEFYKILRQGASRRTFELMHELGLLAYLLPEAQTVMDGSGRESFLESLERLDGYRRAGASADTMSNAVILGSLLVPLGMSLRVMAVRRRTHTREQEAAIDAAGRPADRVDEDAPPAAEEPVVDVAREMAELGAPEEKEPLAPQPPAPVVLPFARRDIDRLRLILASQPRLRDVNRPPAAQRSLAAKPYFDEAVRWLEIHGGTRGMELSAHWRSLDVGDLVAEGGRSAREPGERRPRRRRRRRGPRPAGEGPATKE